MRPLKTIARQYFVRGRVQGVGFRHFVVQNARRLGLRGYARNLDDGRVEVLAVGSAAGLSELEGLLHLGPRWAEVSGVETLEAAPQSRTSFTIED